MAIGLVSENKLPSVYERTTLEGEDAVVIRKGGRKVRIRQSSFSSVANVLSAFAPDGEATLEPGWTITIQDTFSNKEVEVVAGSLADVMASLAVFALKDGEYIPAIPRVGPRGAAPKAEMAEEPIQVQKPARAGRKKKDAIAQTETKAMTSAEVANSVTPEETQAAASEKKRGRKPKEKVSEPTLFENVDNVISLKPADKTPTQLPTPPQNVEARLVAAENGKQKKTTARPSGKAATSKADKAESAAGQELPSVIRAPEFKNKGLSPALVVNHQDRAAGITTKGLPKFLSRFKFGYEIENSQVRLDFTPLVIDPKSKRKVIGIPNDPKTATAYGYEVKADNEHVGWIIIEKEDSLVVTGMPNMNDSVHKDITGVMQRMIFGLIRVLDLIRKTA